MLIISSATSRATVNETGSKVGFSFQKESLGWDSLSGHGGHCCAARAPQKQVSPRHLVHFREALAFKGPSAGHLCTAGEDSAALTFQLT